MNAPKIGPKDFDPYRAQFRDCNCLLCRNVAYANSGHGNIREACQKLLDALKAGTHERVELADHIEQLKVERAARIAEACASGASELHMFGLHRGYHGGNNERLYFREPHDAFFMVGTGIGMTPGRHAAADARLQESRRRFLDRWQVEVERLVLADRRNTCTYFRMSGELCTRHSEEHEPAI